MRSAHFVRVLALVTCFIATIASIAATAEPGKITKATFTVGDESVTYFLYIPKGAPPQTPAPLLLLLHGSGRNGRIMVDEWKKLADKEGVVLLAPNARDPLAWYIPGDGPGLVCALVDDVQKSLSLSRRRTYIFGHSAGAVFALNLAMFESEYFAAVAVHAGAWRSPTDLALPTYALRKIPTAIFVGDRDRFFPVADVEATVAALRKQGIPTEVDIIKGHDHNYYVVSSRINQSAWAMLKQHELEADPKYFAHQFAPR
jgi:poly(3-hydroxybutyrate) depolymerase